MFGNIIIKNHGINGGRGRGDGQGILLMDVSIGNNLSELLTFYDT